MSAKLAAIGPIQRLDGQASQPDVDLLRLIVKVAHLYFERGVRQPEIAARLHLSQPRVSRLLRQAEVLNIVRTTVVVPEGIHADLEEELEAAYGLVDAHVVEVAEDEDEEAFAAALGTAAAAYLQPSLFDLGVVGLMSWSRPIMAMVRQLRPTRRPAATHVVELLGSLRHPGAQLDVSQSTRRMAELLGAEAVYLPTPGVAATPELRDAILGQDPFAQLALSMHERLDFAFVGVGTVGLSELLRRSGNLLTPAEATRMRERGAVGNIDLCWYDADGAILSSPLDGRVIGMSLDQLARVQRSVAVSGGRTKWGPIRGALMGRWFGALITDVGTAEALLAEAPAMPPARRP